jgi:FAD/FMN-containing dehydrogenase
MTPPYFRGEWLVPGGPEYETARPVYNRRMDARPEVIARCAGVSDVVTALRHAQDHALPVDVRATGYSFGGWSRSRGLVIDLSLMHGVQIPPDQRIARLQGGVRGGDLQIEASRHGLGAVTGVASPAGVGLMLGGGIGHLTPRAGYASDNVLRVELVTAAAGVVTASPEENPDLFWAVRGSTGNFGVVTALEVRLHEVPPTVPVGLLSWNLDNLEGPVRTLRNRDWTSDNISLIGLLGPASLDILICHTGPRAEARSDLDRLWSFGAPDEEAVPMRDMPFRDATFLFDDLFPPNRGTIDEQPVAALSDELVDALVAKIREPAGEGERWIELVPSAGAFDRAPELPSALRETALEPTVGVGPGCMWEDPSEDAAHDQWVQDVVDTVRRIGPVNDHRHPAGVGVELDTEAVERMYGDRFPRLRELKRQWDPDNVFHGAHNIPPADA